MSRKAMQMALDMLNEIADDVYCDQKLEGVITALRQALAQPEHEPVYAFRRKGLDDFCTCDKRRYDELAGKPNLFEVTVFYTAPLKREWVGLTEEEVKAIANKRNDYGLPMTGRMWVFVADLTDKLKEKNHG